MRSTWNSSPPTRRTNQRVERAAGVGCRAAPPTRHPRLPRGHDHAGDHRRLLAGPSPCRCACGHRQQLAVQGTGTRTSARHPDRPSQQRHSPKRSRPRPRDHGNAGWSPSRRRGARRVHEAAGACGALALQGSPAQHPPCPAAKVRRSRDVRRQGARGRPCGRRRRYPARASTWSRATTTRGLSCRRSRSPCSEETRSKPFATASKRRSGNTTSRCLNGSPGARSCWKACDPRIASNGQTTTVRGELVEP